jgi:hypothetical protein
MSPSLQQVRNATARAKAEGALSSSAGRLMSEFRAKRWHGQQAF